MIASQNAHVRFRKNTFNPIAFGPSWLQRAVRPGKTSSNWIELQCLPGGVPELPQVSSAASCNALFFSPPPSATRLRPKPNRHSVYAVQRRGFTPVLGTVFRYTETSKSRHRTATVDRYSNRIQLWRSAYRHHEHRRTVETQYHPADGTYDDTPVTNGTREENITPMIRT